MISEDMNKLAEQMRDIAQLDDPEKLISGLLSSAQWIDIMAASVSDLEGKTRPQLIKLNAVIQHERRKLQ